MSKVNKEKRMVVKALRKHGFSVKFYDARTEENYAGDKIVSIQQETPMGEFWIEDIIIKDRKYRTLVNTLIKTLDEVNDFNNPCVYFFDTDVQSAEWKKEKFNAVLKDVKMLRNGGK